MSLKLYNAIEVRLIEPISGTERTIRNNTKGVRRLRVSVETKQVLVEYEDTSNAIAGYSRVKLEPSEVERVSVVHQCTLCALPFETAQGLSGHMRHCHGQEGKGRKQQ